MGRTTNSFMAFAVYYGFVLALYGGTDIGKVLTGHSSSSVGYSGLGLGSGAGTQRTGTKTVLGGGEPPLAIGGSVN